MSLAATQERDVEDVPTERVHVAIVGAGFSGLGAAIRLEREGIEDYVLLEQAQDVGGTWRDNTYPGCACDIPSNLYSFSFAPNPEWSRAYSPQPEIWRYLRGCAERFGILERTRLGCELLEARWLEAEREWRLKTGTGELRARVLILATGGLSEPFVPDLPGLDRFSGPVFHSARWDHSQDLAGRRVAVIGTGASSIQIVPALAGVAERLYVFQRTPPWIMPRRDRPLSARQHRLFRRLPLVQRLVRAALFLGHEATVAGFLHPRVMRGGERRARAHLRRQVPDPELRARLTPTYRMGCKRVLVSDDYLPALTRPDVELVSEGISEIRPDSIVTADGGEHPVDALVLATGFSATEREITDRLLADDGRTLSEAWDRSPRAHMGTCVTGFPNLFLMTGPNTGLGHNSVVSIIEAQLNYIAGALRTMRERDLDVVEVRAAAQQDWTEEIDRRMRGTVWTAGGCNSWYLDAKGRNSTLWPGSVIDFQRRLRRFDAHRYRLVPARAPA